MKNQMNVGFAWEATNWNGVCNDLVKIAKPTLVITGTDDNDSACQFFSYCRKNSCLVQIRDAGHAVMDQYLDTITRVLETFLSTTAQSN
jgi:pimeloyl-ACP methyl ester carboxylesterase